MTLGRSFIVSFSCLLALAIMACDRNAPLTASDWIDSSVAAHGSEKLNGRKLSFGFREHDYTILRVGGRFTYTRTLNTDSLVVIDSLKSSGAFSRHVNGIRTAVSDSMAAKYSESINSVAYFFLLPLPLKDKAVVSELGEVARIRGNRFQTLNIGFRQEGGGTDYQDEFRYWISERDSTVDYLAYRYETDGGGIRFRVATRQHRMDGMLFQDYENFKPSSEQVPLDSLPALWERGELELLSTIENEEIRVD